MTKQNKAEELKHAQRIMHHPEFYWNSATPAGRKGTVRRANWIRDTLKLIPGMRVLEIGCGTGFSSRIFAQSGTELHAIDLAKDFIDRAIKNCEGLPIRFRQCDVEALPYEDRFFDAVIGIRVLHHLDLSVAFEEINRVLKPKGKIGFCEPNMLNPQIMVQKNVLWIKRKIGDTPNETAFFRWRLKRLLRSMGYEQIHIQPFDFLHPWFPDKILTCAEKLGAFFELLPLVREIAGSLRIVAVKER